MVGLIERATLEDLWKEWVKSEARDKQSLSTSFSVNEFYTLAQKREKTAV
jgi:hypothetical protein